MLMFAYTCSSVPRQHSGQRRLSSLASKVNAAIANFPAPSAPVRLQKPAIFRPSSDDANLADRVSSKLEDGDVRGAIRLAASDDTMAPFDDVTADALRSKPPTRAMSDVQPPPTPKTDACLCLQQADILAAIRLFMPGAVMMAYGHSTSKT